MQILFEVHHVVVKCREVARHWPCAATHLATSSTTGHAVCRQTYFSTVQLTTYLGIRYDEILAGL